MPISVFIIPILLISLMVYSLKKRVNAYGAFANGAKGALELCRDIFPFIIAVFLIIKLMQISGLAVILSKIFSPVMQVLGIPEELSQLMLIRPFSGSGSLVLLEDIFKTYGPDSYPARCASVIMGSSETTFYIATIYLSKTKAKKLLYAIPVALIATLIGAIIACQICKIM